MSLLAGDVVSTVDGQHSPLQYKTVNTAGFAGIATNYRSGFGRDAVRPVATNALVSAEHPTSADQLAL